MWLLFTWDRVWVVFEPHSVFFFIQRCRQTLQNLENVFLYGATFRQNSCQRAWFRSQCEVNLLKVLRNVNWACIHQVVGANTAHLVNANAMVFFSEFWHFHHSFPIRRVMETQPRLRAEVLSGIRSHEAAVKLNEAPEVDGSKQRTKNPNIHKLSSLTKGTKPSVTLSASDPTSAQTRRPHFLSRRSHVQMRRVSADGKTIRETQFKAAIKGNRPLQRPESVEKHVSLWSGVTSTTHPTQHPPLRAAAEHESKTLDNEKD